MALIGPANAAQVKKWRDIKRALGLCIKCDRNPPMKDKDGFPMSKCKPCAIRSANEMVEYRERIKNRKI